MDAPVIDPTKHTLLSYDKSTANTHLYKAVLTHRHPPAVRSIYIEKWALADPAPKTIAITIEIK